MGLAVCQFNRLEHSAKGGGSQGRTLVEEVKFRIVRPIKMLKEQGLLVEHNYGYMLATEFDERDRLLLGPDLLQKHAVLLAQRVRVLLQQLGADRALHR